MSRSGKIGLITGSFSGFWMILEYLLGLNVSSYNQYSAYIGLVIYFTGVFLAIQQTRDKELGGFIDYKYALRTGIKTATIAALVWAAFTLVYYQFINPDFLKQANPGISEADAREASRIANQIRILIFFIGFNILMGTFFSLIAGAILRREKGMSSY